MCIIGVCFISQTSLVMTKLCIGFEPFALCSSTVCHRISTYEFIINSRDSQAGVTDVEAGTKSPSNRKLFKVF